MGQHTPCELLAFVTVSVHEALDYRGSKLDICPLATSNFQHLDLESTPELSTKAEIEADLSSPVIRILTS
jgi:hypothetical protein